MKMATLVSMVVKKEKKDMMDCSEKYILEYGDSKLVIPNEVGLTEDGKSLKVDLKDDEDIKKFVGNCQGSEGTYLDQAQEDKEMDESPIKQKPISLKEKPRIPLDCVDAIASASDIIPIRSSADGDVDNKQENGSFGVKQGTGTTVELLSDDDGDLYSSEEEEPNLEEGHQISDLNSNTEVDNKTEIDNSTPLDPSLKSALLKEDSGAAPDVSQEQDGKWYKPAAGKLIIFLVVCSKIFAVFAVAQNQDFSPVSRYIFLNSCDMCPEIPRLNCSQNEKEVCIRNYDWKTLVLACVVDIKLYDACPYFTNVTRNGVDYNVAVLQDVNSKCKNCSSYRLWDVQNKPQCQELEGGAKNCSTDIDHQARSSDGLGGGAIAGIVIGVCFFLLGIILVCLCRLGYLQNLMDRIFPCLRGIPVGQNVV